MGSKVREVGELDFVFPMWIVAILPPGVSGLVLAGIFAACISSLDSILAALSQTTHSAIYHPEKRSDEDHGKMNLIVKTRWLIIGWGCALTGFTLVLNVVREGIPILGLAFGMSACTMGPLLGLMFCALAGRGSIRGLMVGSGGSFQWLAHLPTYPLNEATDIFSPHEM